jgi:phosphoglycolate phosphatase-like HAD superfamily hydrolase
VLRLLSLDFDGVIADSAPEAFVVALRTYCELRPDARFAGREALLAGGAPAPQQIEADPLYCDFLELMPLGNRAEDYAVALAALDSGTAIPDQSAYDACRDGFDPGWLRTFHKRFYRVRAALSDRDPDGWQRLIGPYPAFLALLRRRASEVVLAIATAKDRRSVGALLRIYGIEDLIPEDCVLDKETGVSKVTHHEHLRALFGFDYAEMTFLDDKVNHLDAVAPLGVRCGLASWGFNGVREVELARAHGHLVCTLDDVEEQVFGDAPS